MFPGEELAVRPGSRILSRPKGGSHVGISGPTSDQLIPGPTYNSTLDQLFVFLSAGYVYVTWTNEMQSTFTQLHVSSSVDYDSS